MKRHIVVPLKLLLLLTAKYLHLFSWLPRNLRIIMYHGVGCSDFPEESFELQMRFISKHFESYWVSEAVSLLNGDPNYSAKKPPIILTFDDGLLNNATTAAPILDKYGLKATFFVCSDLIDGKSMLWNHELRCRLQLLPSDKVYEISNGRCPDNSEESVKTFSELVKRWPGDEVSDLMFLLRKDCPQPNYDEKMLQDYLIMSVEDICRLPECVEIGSHTKSHPILDTLDEEEIENQVVNSKKDLSRMLGKNVGVFCYPNGMSNSFCNQLVADNYAVAVTTDEGFAADSDNFSLLKRIPPAEKLHDFVWRLIRPIG
ncbi:MAG: polysaccharide deacetylase family protein [Granulosicoccus sp.]